MKLLRIAFLAGAIIDAGALLPMLIPRLAGWVWGFRDVSASYRFAMGYGASLMFGWTVLLLWAYRRPLERRFVAALTALVVVGLILAEVVAVFSGAVEPRRLIPTWCLQAALLVLFIGAYRYQSVNRAATRDNAPKGEVSGPFTSSQVARPFSTSDSSIAPRTSRLDETSLL
jgi:hypothetical protein